MKIELVEIAKRLYTTYCESVGGKAYNGDPLPTAEEFFEDPETTIQSTAWLMVAKESVEDQVEKLRDVANSVSLLNCYAKSEGEEVVCLHCNSYMEKVTPVLFACINEGCPNTFLSPDEPR